LAVFGTIASAFFLATSYFLISRIGLFIRAAGDNESMVQELGVNTNWLYLLGLGLSNALIAISGALVAQSQGFADVGMGTGLVVTAIAALILGEGFLAGIGAIRKVMSTVRLKARPRNLVTSQLRLLPWNILVELVAAVVGALLYFFILSICLRLGLAPTDLKLATGILVIGGKASPGPGPPGDYRQVPFAVYSAAVGSVTVPGWPMAAMAARCK
jgi:putative ABC transport system permease protein